MDRTKITAAVQEARRFLDRADTLLAATDENSRSWNNPKERGALRRASMDLTRALADLRGRAS